MAKRSKEDIIKLVAQYDLDNLTLHKRMSDDYNLYRLETYTGNKGFKNYTSNEPMTFADKIISWLVSSKLLIQVPADDHPREAREQNNLMERFMVGMLRQADELLTRLVMPTIRQQLSFYIAIRGWYAGRASLVKRKDGSVYCDITPFDPLHVSYALGGDGLAWLCYTVKKTPSEIEAQYGVKVTYTSNGKDADSAEQGMLVYDFYDTEDNMVFTDGDILKKRTPHGSPAVPCFVGAVGTAPPIQAETMDGTRSTYGESIYAASREVGLNFNYSMSVMTEFVHRSEAQGVKVRSKSGAKTLAANPYLAGAEISLADGEDIQPLGLLETAKEMGAYLGLVSGEKQRGTLPHSVYGDLEFQLSGYAINTLRQGIETPLIPRVAALINAYHQALFLLKDQYLTNKFETVTLSGRDRNRSYFNQEITPDALRESNDPEIKILPVLPQDDITKYNIAQIAREGNNPLVPDLFIRDNILGLEDSDLVDDALKEQAGERMLPEASLWAIMNSLANRGRNDLAQFYFAQLLQIISQKQQQGQFAYMPGPEGGIVGGPQTQGIDPRAAPGAALGQPPPQPTPQGGGLTAPGTPRPNRRSGDDVLAQRRELGLA
jgi:hypothetical protein